MKKPKETDSQHGYRYAVYDLGADEEGEPINEIREFQIKSIQAMGDFAGATLEIQGSIIPGQYELMNDYEAIPLSFTGRGLKTGDDRVGSLKPVVRGGTADTKITVGILICR